MPEFSQRLVIHEAGHAIVAHALDCRVLSAQVSDAGGWVDFLPPGSLLDHVAILAAGDVAVCLLTGRVEIDRHKPDRRRIAELLGDLPAEDQAAVQQAAERKAEAVLLANWAQVRRLSDRLLCVGRINEDEVLDLLGGFHGG